METGTVSGRRETLWRLAGGLAAVLLLLAMWQAVHLRWGPFIMPDPRNALAALFRMIGDGSIAPAAARTALNALGGFAAGSLFGALLGLAAGLSRPLGRVLGPAVTIILGVPPIAWVVMALLWFGSDGAGATAVVLATTFPLVFAGTVQGVRTLDPAFVDLARSFGAGPRTMVVSILLPHVFSYLFPALASAHGIAWKAAVTAEVMGTGGGIGERLATARANLDTAEAMALVVLVVALLLLVDGLVLNPFRRRVERWRTHPE